MPETSNECVLMQCVNKIINQNIQISLDNNEDTLVFNHKRIYRGWSGRLVNYLNYDRGTTLLWSIFDLCIYLRRFNRLYTDIVRLNTLTRSYQGSWQNKARSRR